MRKGNSVCSHYYFAAFANLCAFALKAGKLERRSTLIFQSDAANLLATNESRDSRRCVEESVARLGEIDAGEFAGVGEDLDAAEIDAAEGASIAVAEIGLAVELANADAGDLIWEAAGECAVDFWIVLARVADE